MPGQATARAAQAGPACADWSRSQGLLPVGTAGTYSGFLLVEQPLPWPHDISDLPELGRIAKVAAPAGVRVQAVFDRLVPAHPADVAAGPRRLVYYRSNRHGWTGPLSRSEVLVPRERLLEAAESLILSDGILSDGILSDGILSDGILSDGNVGPPFAPSGVGGGAARDGQQSLVDVLVCTHGRRDACCGSRGTELFAELRAGLDAPAAPTLVPVEGSHDARAAGSSAPPQVRLWRTSHTGGHRFAPTALVLPSATLWAWADVPLLHRVAAADGALDDLLPHYRGCATIGPPRHQALEGAVLAETGWALLSSYRRAVDGTGELVRLESEVAGEWEATVRAGRRVPQPDCHTPPEAAVKFGTEWVVEGLWQVTVP